MFSIPTRRDRCPLIEERRNACPPLHPRRAALAPRLPRRLPRPARAGGGRSRSVRRRQGVRAGVCWGWEACRQHRRLAGCRLGTGVGGAGLHSRVDAGAAAVTSRTVSTKNSRCLASQDRDDPLRQMMEPLVLVKIKSDPTDQHKEYTKRCNLMRWIRI